MEPRNNYFWAIKCCFFSRSASSRARSVAIVTRRNTILLVANSSMGRPVMFVELRHVGQGMKLALEKPFKTRRKLINQFLFHQNKKVFFLL